MTCLLHIYFALLLTGVFNIFFFVVIMATNNIVRTAQASKRVVIQSISAKDSQRMLLYKDSKMVVLTCRTSSLEVSTR